ncbi:hypothetical protein DZC30_15625 [Comamonas testosteroni]|uniref:Flagellar protein FlgN n=1 Tax=Comamonas testosteroni TaxID=285 RepID=A0A373FGI3_COMTE|nr:hypothetical protein [Comamonas testosteroni]RGE43248.1 hypothetical protein DZC30_15625 [Comamonas testosteroni]
MTLQEMLDSLDAVIQTVSASLHASDASALEQSSTRLRDAMIAFSQLVKRFSPEDWTPALRERAQKLGADMALLRDQLTRLTVLAQRRAQTLVPASGEDATYEGRLLGKTASSGRARIYHAAS